MARSRKRPAESGDTPSFAATPLMHRIREMIFNGELAPGQRVTEEAVADLLGVSRTPVRNLLPMLALQGLLLPAGRRGFAVRAFSDKESWEALELGLLLEGQAARMLATGGASAHVLSALEACLAIQIPHFAVAMRKRKLRIYT